MRRLFVLLSLVVGLVGLSASMAAAHYNEGEGHEEACSKRGPKESNPHCQEGHPGHPGYDAEDDARRQKKAADSNDVRDTERPCRVASARVHPRAEDADGSAEDAYDGAPATPRKRRDNVTDTAPHVAGSCGTASQADGQAEQGYDTAVAERAAAQREADARQHEAESCAEALANDGCETANEVIDPVEEAANRARGQAGAARDRVVSAVNDAIDDVQEELE